MPLDVKKAHRLALEKYPGRREGTLAQGPLDEALREASKGHQFRSNAEGSMNYDTFRALLQGRSRVYLDQVEALSRALGVPITELLDSRGRSDQYEAGMAAGVAIAAGELQDALNRMIVEYVPTSERAGIPEPLT